MLQLQQNVSDWKQSYDQLMKELRKLSLEKVVEREELVKKVKVLSSKARVGQRSKVHSAGQVRGQLTTFIS